MGQLAVLLKGAGAEIHGAVGRRVGVALLNQGPDHVQHTADLLRGQGMDGGGLYIHGSHILLALLDIALGNGIRVHALLDGLLNDLVVHVREIGHVLNLVTLVLKIAAHGVKHDHGPGVSNVDEIVHRGSAHVHLHNPRSQRNKLFFPSAQRVKYFHTLTLLGFYISAPSFFWQPPQPPV